MNVHDHQGIQDLLDVLGLRLDPGLFVPRYNVAPGMGVMTVYQDGARELATMEWGITPRWSTPARPARALINARAETVWDKPAFRDLIATRRAVIPVNGFYEWRRAGNARQPYYIHGPTAGALALAGIYQLTRDGELQCCVLTTEANPTMARIHERMPVILSPESMTTWLDPASDRAGLAQLMAPTPAEWITAYPVASYVNNARHAADAT